MTLSLGQYTTVLLMLQELKQYDKAALFLQTCLKNKLLEKNVQTGNLSTVTPYTYTTVRRTGQYPQALFVLLKSKLFDKAAI